jgi:hypothetical protein
MCSIKYGHTGTRVPVSSSTYWYVHVYVPVVFNTMVPFGTYSSTTWCTCTTYQYSTLAGGAGSGSSVCSADVKVFFHTFYI